LLHRWQQQPHQDTDDGDHHQQFDERESSPWSQMLHLKVLRTRNEKLE
jgi:hypothetical protein